MPGTYRLKNVERRAADPIQSRMLPSGRLTSLDAFRGFIMIALAAHGFGFAHFANLPEEAPVWKSVSYDTWQTIGFHFRHARWVTVDSTHWISFWDLIQPAFMFMVGVAMPFSYARRYATGQSDGQRLLHAAVRAVVLVLLGVFLYSVGHERTNWIFPNVLAQIGLGYFFVYLMLSRQAVLQLTAIAAILIGYWALFWWNPPPENYDYAAVNASVEDGEVFTDRMAPWSKNSNIAFRIDQWLLPQLRTPAADQSEPSDDAAADDAAVDVASVDDASPQSDSSSDSIATADADVDADTPPEFQRNVIRDWFFSNPEPYSFNRGGYTTLNFVPSIATALLGVLCGQLLLSGQSQGSILLTLLLGGGICIALGLGAHVTVCPIVKRIWTPSWTLFSGGCVIWMLAVFFLLFDMLPLRKLALPLQVVGMNSLAVYLMGELLPDWVGANVVGIHLSGFLESVLGTEMLRDDMYGRIIGPTTVALIFWLLTVYMYRNRLFVRI